jgi:hypothetical protein
MFRRVKEECEKYEILINESQILNDFCIEQVKKITEMLNFKNFDVDDFICAYNRRTFTMKEDKHKIFRKFRNCLNYIVKEYQNNLCETLQANFQLDNFEILPKNYQKQMICFLWCDVGKEN